MPEDDQQPTSTPTPPSSDEVSQIHAAGSVIRPQVPAAQPGVSPATGDMAPVSQPVVTQQSWPQHTAQPVAAAIPGPAMTTIPALPQEPATQPEVAMATLAPAPPAASASTLPDANADVSPMPEVPANDPPAADASAVQPATPRARSDLRGSLKAKLMSTLRRPAGIAVVAVAGALVIGGGYVFGLYLPNTPSGIFSGSLDNTGRAIDSLIAYTKQQDASHYKSVSYDGTLHLKSASGSADATLTGLSDESGNTSLSAAADIMGQKATVDVRSIQAAGNTSPDVYFRIAGLKPLLDQDGLGGFDSLDGQWITIDHTFLDTYAAQLQSGGSPSASRPDTAMAPTYAQLNDAAEKMQVVNRQYLFTTNSSQALLQLKKFVGTEHAGSRTLNHYIISWDKQHLTAYIDAMKTALDSSKLNDWAKASSAKSLSAMLELDRVRSNAQNAKSGYTFDLWADTATRLVSKVSFSDPSDSNSVFSIAQNYYGGGSYPISMVITSKDGSGNNQNGSFGLTIDTAAHTYTGTFAMDSADTSGTTTLDATVRATPGNKAAQVTAPAGSKPLTDVLNMLGLGGLISPGQSSASDAMLAPFVLQQ